MGFFDWLSTKKERKRYFDLPLKLWALCGLLFYGTYELIRITQHTTLFVLILALLFYVGRLFLAMTVGLVIIWAIIWAIQRLRGEEGE